VRELVLPPRPKGFELWFFGSGNGRVEPLGPLTLMDGTDGITETEGTLLFSPRVGVDPSLTEMIGLSGVTEMEGTLASCPLVGAGNSLMDMLGIGGVTPVDGDFALRPQPLLEPLNEMDGVADTEIVGIEGGKADWDRAEGAW
jgi:hypothetical protein